MLWDIIRDWFVQYIFGGITSTGEVYSGYIGLVARNTFDYEYAGTGYFMLPINGLEANTDLLTHYISMGDWLSTTSTIILLVLMCIFLFLCVRYLFRLTSGLLMGR